METVFRIKVSELNDSFLKTIKSLFKKDKEVEIIVHPAQDTDDETSYLLSTEANRKTLEKSLAEAKAGNLINVNINKLK